jgi:RNA polymerase sigma-70 factor (ECF subfamily)
MEAIEIAESLLRAASSAGPTGRCQLEAAIQSAHVARRLSGTDNWPIVVKLYDILLAMTGSPVVLLNRAAALAETEGPAAALQSIAPLAEDKRMADYQPYWAVRGRLLAETGNREAAHEALTLAMGLSTDPAIRDWLEARRAELIVG